jgi:arabinose-5-phosphate isomerase
MGATPLSPDADRGAALKGPPDPASATSLTNPADPMHTEPSLNRLTPRRGEPGRAQRWPDDQLVALGRDVFVEEAAALRAVGERLDARFATAVRWLYACEGRVLVTGLGKSGIVARKVASTLTSTGTPALFIHPVEALHGDIGIATAADILLAFSRSGGNEELLVLASSLKALGLRTIVATGNVQSALARACDLTLDIAVAREVCPLDLTPTTSTTAAAVMGDALTVTLLRLRDFRREDFALFHPSGALGRALRTTVADLMHRDDALPVVQLDMPMREALLLIAQKRLGCACVVDGQGLLVGFLTDGDYKRALLRDVDPMARPVREYMSHEPKLVDAGCLARVALTKMENNKPGPITQLVIVELGRPAGVIHMHDILRAGLSA